MVTCCATMLRASTVPRSPPAPWPPGRARSVAYSSSPVATEALTTCPRAGQGRVRPAPPARRHRHPATSTVSVALTRWALPVVGAIVLSAARRRPTPIASRLHRRIGGRSRRIGARGRCEALLPDRLGGHVGAGKIRRLPHLQTRAQLRRGSRSEPPAYGKRNRLNGACAGLSAESSPYTCPQLGGCSGARSPGSLISSGDDVMVSHPLFELRERPTQPRRDGGRRDPDRRDDSSLSRSSTIRSATTSRSPASERGDSPRASVTGPHRNPLRPPRRDSAASARSSRRQPGVRAKPVESGGAGDREQPRAGRSQTRVESPPLAERRLERLAGQILGHGFRFLVRYSR